jgi:hypothetical protein
VLRYREERRPLRDRDAALRVPDERVDDFLAPALRAVDFLFVVALRAVDLFAVDLRAVERLAVDRLAVDFRLAVVFRFAVVFRLAVDFRFAVERFAVDRLAVVLRAVDFLFVVDFLAVDFRFAPPDLRAVVLRADVDLRAAVFFFAADFFFVPDFFAEDFFAVDFFRPELRVDPERELLPEERDDDRRVVAGTAIVRSTSAPSLASPIAESPHVSSGSAVGSLHEPAVDVSDASPVPLQSSSVIETS